MASSWFSFPFSIPSFSAPLSIQKRFVSFILKRALGHLLKPGQLDPAQIDAQIGDGYIEVKDLELDCSAVDALLGDHPVCLQEGSIKSVVVRTSWSNPFSSTIGLSVNGLHLALAFRSRPCNDDANDNTKADLSQSVAHVADEFIHEALTSNEENILRDAIHDQDHLAQETEDYQSGIPGSLGPTQSDGARTSVEHASDPEGVSIFAGLIEKILSRFSFTAEDIQVTLLHETTALYVFRINKVRYFSTQDSIDEGLPHHDERVVTRGKRVLWVDGLWLGVRSLKSKASSPAPSLLLTSRSAGHPLASSRTAEPGIESRSMSKSTLLPPSRNSTDIYQSSSFSSSVDSSIGADQSMYESALEESQTALGLLNQEEPGSDWVGDSKEENIEEEPLLAISEPVEISLLTPPPYDPDHTAHTNDETDQKGQRHEKLNLVVSVGVVAISARAQNINLLLQTLEMLASGTISPRRTERSDEKVPSEQISTPLTKFRFTARIKDIVMLLYNDEKNVSRDNIGAFFDKPLAPAFIPCGYTRFHVDFVELASVEQESSPSTSSIRRTSTSGSQLLHLIISDISLLAFHPIPPSSSSRRNKSTPILVCDPFLAESYQHHKESNTHKRNPPARAHNHPESPSDQINLVSDIALVDWLSENCQEHGTNLRHWRTRAPHLPTSSHRHSSMGRGIPSVAFKGTSQEQINKGDPASVQQPNQGRDPTILVTFFREPSSAIEILVRPVHVFLNLGLLPSAMAYLDTIRASPELQGSSQFIDPQDSDTETTIAEAAAREIDRATHLASDELGLELDYSSPVDATRKSSTEAQVIAYGVKSDTNMSIRVRLDLLRFEVRVPAPNGKEARTGLIVLDLHDAYYSHQLTRDPSPRSIRFDENNEQTKETSRIDHYTDSVKIRRLVLAYCALGKARATCIVSVGPIQDPGSSIGDIIKSPSLFPCAMLRPATKTLQSSYIFFNIPSVYTAIDKANFDGLQLWVDHIGQWADNLNRRNVSRMTTRTGSRETSILGSNFFLQQGQSKGVEMIFSETTPQSSTRNEVIVRVTISEALLRLSIPTDMALENGNVRPIEASLSDLDVIFEMSPRGKDETVISVDIAKAVVTEHRTDGARHLIAPKAISAGDKQEAVKIRFSSVSLPGTMAKESRIRLTVHGICFDIPVDVVLFQDIGQFAKSPPGAFEAVVPSERTQISVNFYETAIRLSSPLIHGAVVFSLGDVCISTQLSGNSQETVLDAAVTTLTVLFVDDCQSSPSDIKSYSKSELDYWLDSGYALIATVQNTNVYLKHGYGPMMPDTSINLNDMDLSVHLCADSISGIAAYAADLSKIVESQKAPPVSQTPAKERKSNLRKLTARSSNLLGSVDEQAFRRHPVIGPLPDLISDDLPSNPEYLDASFSAAAGFRELDDDDEFSLDEEQTPKDSSGVVISKHGGETVRMLWSNSLSVTEFFYDTMTADNLDLASEYGDTGIKVQARNCNIRLILHDGYDWERTRRVIKEEANRVKRRLAKIRQLLANGQTYNPDLEEVNTVLFNSVHVGLEEDIEGLEPDALLAAIDDELKDNDGDDDAASESSWQTFEPETGVRGRQHNEEHKTKKLHREKEPSIEFRLEGFSVDFNCYRPGASLTSRLLFTIKELEILDHIRTSTWNKFLTGMQADNRGNVRETESNMVRVELQMLLPYDEDSGPEARLKAKLLPLRLHVDQDALDFLKKFFSFKDEDAKAAPSNDNEIFFQHVEIFPVDIMLDYKPRRVDYKALKEGRTIELMNFFHFDGAEMTLRHITLKGVTGWPRMFDTLNDLWTPDVKANQLADVISGVSPIRSAVNVGSGVADLILLPIAQYKKDGRVIRGLQKGTTAFVKSTAVEAIRLGARLATGTQVVLEQAESIFGGQFQGPVTAEALQTSPLSGGRKDLDEEPEELISKYAEQPANISEGVQSAYKTLSQNIKTAGQTILAVPMEVYERSGKEGPALPVIRAVPIAVLKPMIGASEAISKTLMGLHNTLDPQVQMETDAKYKHR